MSLEVQIMQFLIDNPKSTDEEIAKELKLELIDVVTTIKKLFRKAKIKVVK